MSCKKIDINTTNKIKIKKCKFGVEDLLWGTGTQEQIRGGRPITITEINARHIPYDDKSSMYEKIEDLVIITENMEYIQIVANDLKGFCPVKWDFGSVTEQIDETIKCCGSSIKTVARHIDDVIYVAENVRRDMYLRKDQNLSDVACYHLARINLSVDDFGYIYEIAPDGTFILKDENGEVVATCEDNPLGPPAGEYPPPGEPCGQLIKAQQIQLRRGTTEEHNSFTGVEGETTYNTTEGRLVVHSGTEAIPHARLDELTELEDRLNDKFDDEFTDIWNTIYEIQADIERIDFDLVVIKQDIALLFENKANKADIPRFATNNEALLGTSVDTIISPATLKVAIDEILKNNLNDYTFGAIGWSGSATFYSTPPNSSLKMPFVPAVGSIVTVKENGTGNARSVRHGAISVTQGEYSTYAGSIWGSFLPEGTYRVLGYISSVAIGGSGEHQSYDTTTFFNVVRLS